MASRLRLVKGAARRVPTQARGHERVARLLAAAEAVIAEQGYEAATMCAIAERAQTAIGSLYQFFPNKEALVEALRTRYAAARAPLWSALTRDAPRLPPEAIARRLVELVQEAVRLCPAFPALLMDAPRTAGSRRRRDVFRRRIAGVLRARWPGLSAAETQRQAAVLQQLLRGLLALHGAYAADFEQLLSDYLKPQSREAE